MLLAIPYCCIFKMALLQRCKKIIMISWQSILLYFQDGLNQSVVARMVEKFMISGQSILLLFIRKN